jgi:hypothetical protein
MTIIMVFQLIFGNYLVAYANTRLIFRTRAGAQGYGVATIPLGSETELGIINDVSPYRKIRVCAYERTGSASDIKLRLLPMEGNDIVGELEQISLTPNSASCKIYDVPGVRLKILAASARAAQGSNFIDVTIYGSD